MHALVAASNFLWGEDAEFQQISSTSGPRAVRNSSEASHRLWGGQCESIRLGELVHGFCGSRMCHACLCNVSVFTFVPSVWAGSGVYSAIGLGRTGISLAGAVVAISFGLRHSFWLLAFRPDAYRLWMLLLSVSVWVAVSMALARSVRRGVVAVLAIGAALTSHVISLASISGIVLIAFSQLPLTTCRVGLLASLGFAVSAVAAGVAGVMGFPVEALVRAIFSYQTYLPTLHDAILVCGYLIYHVPFVVPVPFVARIPLARLGLRISGGILVVFFGVVGFMLFRYHPVMYVRDRHIFPAVVAAGCRHNWVGCGVGGLTPAPDAPFAGMVLVGPLVAAAGAPLLVYPVGATVAGLPVTRLVPARALPGRDLVCFYRWRPKTGYVGACDYLAAAFSVLPDVAVVLADWLPYQPMRYVQAVECCRYGVHLEIINVDDGRLFAFLYPKSLGVPL